MRANNTFYFLFSERLRFGKISSEDTVEEMIEKAMTSAREKNYPVNDTDVKKIDSIKAAFLVVRF